jgi:hypothetical protein
MTIRIVFVDDEVNILEGMRRAFHSMRGMDTIGALVSGHSAFKGGAATGIAGWSAALNAVDSELAVA